MAVQLIAEVLRAVTGSDLTPAERLVLILIAERANAQSREAWSGGTDRWDLARLAGLSPTGLRAVLQKLAARGHEVRVAHGKDATGRPIFAAWNRQTTYRLPILLGDTPVSPVGDAQVSPTPARRRQNPGSQATKSDHLGDTQASLGDTPVSPFSSSPSGPSGPVTDGRASPRPASPRDEPVEEQPLPADEARARARAIAAQAQKSPPKISHWATVPQGERNDAYDPAGTAERLAAVPAWELADSNDDRCRECGNRTDSPYHRNVCREAAA